jgi:lipopolysaccharide transport system ATP-binding protein
MSDIAIQVEGLSKQYRLGTRERYRTLRDTLSDALTAPFRRFPSADSSNESPETFWALKDVSFDVKHGEVIGVIGSNGAGKSTLLKVLSRITEPTEGQARVHGRIASLLEVGTGFHPELSGRDNIFLNGAILGMKKAEIRRKFDEIVAFAEVDKFIDTPVKHYSSGMYVRLAFAVAAHLEPEILIVDEVLAVGDFAFQKKCMGKMGDVAKMGKTVILVSHSMASISALCHSGILLESGRRTFFGPAEQAIDRYLAGIALTEHEINLAEDKDRRRGSGELRIVSARVLDQTGRPETKFSYPETISVEFEVEGPSSFHNFLSVVLVRTTTGITVLHVPTPPGLHWPRLEHGDRATIKCTIPRCRLYPGTYIVSLWIGRNAHMEVDWAPDVLAFSVDQGDLASYGFDMSWKHGLYFCDSEWSMAPGSLDFDAITAQEKPALNGTANSPSFHNESCGTRIF